MRKPINPTQHGIIDYGFAAALLLAPVLLGLKGPAKKLAYAEGLNTLTFNGLSDTSVGISRVFSFNPAHKILDIVNVAGLYVLPRVTGAMKQPKAKTFFNGILLAAIAHVLLTDYEGDTKG